MKQKNKIRLKLKYIWRINWSNHSPCLEWKMTSNIKISYLIMENREYKYWNEIDCDSSESFTPKIINAKLPKLRQRVKFRVRMLIFGIDLWIKLGLVPF